MICFTTSVGALRLRIALAHAILNLLILFRLLSIPKQLSHFPNITALLPHTSEKKDLLNQPLVDPHLVRIPRLTPLSAGRLPRRHLQALGR